MRGASRFFLATLASLSLLSSCGLLIQDSVTFHGTQCSDSYVWMAGDLAATGLFMYGASQEGGVESAAYVVPAGLVASGVIGYYKRKNCVAHQKNASPEEWQRDQMRNQGPDLLDVAGAVAGAAIVESAGSSGGQSQSSSHKQVHREYKNRVKHTCNGSVLVDKTFYDRDECVQFARDNEFYCQGYKLPISC